MISLAQATCSLLRCRICKEKRIGRSIVAAWLNVMKMVCHILIFISFYLLMQSDEVSTNKHIYVNTTYVGCSVLNSYVGYGPFVFANSSVGYLCKFVAECKIRSPVLLLQCHVSLFVHYVLCKWHSRLQCTLCNTLKLHAHDLYWLHIYNFSVIWLVVFVSLFALLVISH